MELGPHLTQLGLIFGLGMAAQWLGWRLRVPVIILLLGTGLVAGPLLGLIQPREVFGELFNPLIELAVAVILFEGGMSLRISEFRTVAAGLLRLFSLAVLLHLFFGLLAGMWIGGLSWQISLLLGAILVVTGPTVIIPALREARLRQTTSRYLKWEGIVNDPTGAMLAVLIYQFILQGHEQPGPILIDIVQVLATALSLALAAALGLRWASRHALIPQFLKVPCVLTLVILLYIISEQVQGGSGLATATVLGLLIGNSREKTLGELRRFEESVVIFAVSSIFIMLAATLDIEAWTALEARHYLLILLFAFVLRPLAVLLGTAGSSMPWRERVLIALYGPRGIVAASVAGVTGAGLQAAGMAEAQVVMPIVFSVIILTVIVHSLWLRPLSRALGLKIEDSQGVLLVGASPWSIDLADKLRQLDIPVLLADHRRYKLVPARQRGIPIHQGRILHDIEHGEPDLAPFEYLLALSDDDAYNGLLVHKLSHLFGADHVYRLPPHRDSAEGEAAGGELLDEGRYPAPLYEEVNQRFHRGWTFRSVTLTEQYGYVDFRREHDPANSLPLLLVREDGRIQLAWAEDLAPPEAGDRLIYQNWTASADAPATPGTRATTAAAAARSRAAPSADPATR